RPAAGSRASSRSTSPTYAVPRTGVWERQTPGLTIPYARVEVRAARQERAEAASPDPACRARRAAPRTTRRWVPPPAHRRAVVRRSAGALICADGPRIRPPRVARRPGRIPRSGSARRRADVGEAGARRRPDHRLGQRDLPGHGMALPGGADPDRVLPGAALPAGPRALAPGARRARPRCAGAVHRVGEPRHRARPLARPLGRAGTPR